MHYSYVPDVEGLLAFFAMSSATKEVATLRRGILKSFEIMLKSDMETPAEPNSTEPEQELCMRGKETKDLTIFQITRTI